jgi:hypothetical protein
VRLSLGSFLEHQGVDTGRLQLSGKPEADRSTTGDHDVMLGCPRSTFALNAGRESVTHLVTYTGDVHAIS